MRRQEEQIQLQQEEREQFQLHQEVEELPTASVSVGPVKVNYGNIWTDVFAGTFIVILVIVAYYFKKRIDKKFK